MGLSDIISMQLVELYGKDAGSSALIDLRHLVDQYCKAYPHLLRSSRGEVTQRDSILIAYGDQISEPGVKPLRSLAEFCKLHLMNIISGIHILPFFPFSSDDGFSVIDYKTVNPELGDWDDISAIGTHFRLMFDAVINHVSAQSEWFASFLQGNPEYNDFFIEVKGNPDLAQVVRPRALPLLTEYKTPGGSKSIWTTFSTDQVDLNYHNPRVLLKIIDILLFYASQGAEFLRLDAIAYLWKEIGTACIHLNQTHLIVQLFRALLDSVYPQVLLITETNVPHSENISYFGDGANEAQLVYNFALPPLVLHALYTGSSSTLSKWAGGLELPSSKVTFFNFLASHDGIGLNPVRGILTEAEIQAMVDEVEAHGGLVSYKQNPDGTQSPYELNINYFDALSNPRGDEPDLVGMNRFIVAQAIMLALAGVPGIYFHSLFGSRGWPEGVQATGRNRTINRQKLKRQELEQELKDPDSRRFGVFTCFQQMLSARSSSTAFHPNGVQKVLNVGEGVFALLRISPDGKQRVFCLHNLTNDRLAVSLNWMGELTPIPLETIDLITGRSSNWRPGKTWIMEPYQVDWLKLQ
jgi:glycosidase